MNHTHFELDYRQALTYKRSDIYLYACRDNDSVK